MTRNRLFLYIGLAVGFLSLLGAGGYITLQLLFPSPEVVVTATPEAIATLDAEEDADGEIGDHSPSNGASGTFVQAVGMAPITLSPVYAIDSAAQSIIDKIYPRLLGQDPNDGFVVPTALATSWEISEDGRTYTFHLRDGVRWSDGEPVSANDFKFTYDALASPLVQSPYRDRTVGITRIDTPDPKTVVVTLAAPNCSVLHSLRQPLLPSHRFAPDFSDIAINPLNQVPELSAGPFQFAERVVGEKVLLTHNPDYWQGAVQIEQWEVRILPDPNARRQALAAGEIDLTYFAPSELVEMPEEFRDATTGDTTGDTTGNSVTKVIPTDGYSFLALNLADPATPQPGFGTSSPQAPHPILSDLAVRQAIASAIDYERLLDEVFNGYASRAASYVPSTVSWAYANDLPLPSYDPARAAQRLADAGWVEDGNGTRMRDGTPLQLTLHTNEDNPQRVQMAQLIAEQLRAVGIEVELGIVPFDQITELLLGQQFDLVVIGWENLGADPGNSPFWSAQADIPGTGFNFTSFQDAEVDGWLTEAAQLADCNPNTRADLYRQVQQRIAEQHPYILLATQESAWGYQKRWQGIDPLPWSVDYNVTSWRLR